MADVPHYCSACGEIHGGSSAESPEVKVARINADRDIEIAKLARSEARQEIEAEIEQTEIVAEATVEEAVIEAAILEEIVTPDPEPQAEQEPVPVEIEEPEAQPEPVMAPPETESAAEEEKSPGWWGSYN